MKLDELEEGKLYTCVLTGVTTLTLMTEKHTSKDEEGKETVHPSKMIGKIAVKQEDGSFKYSLLELHDGQLEEINKSIREEILDDKINDKINDISSFLDDAPKFTGITYRGLSFNLDNPNEVKYYQDFMKDLEGLEKIEFKSFMSTSIRKEKSIEFTDVNAPKSMNFMNFVFEIKSKNGVTLSGISRFGSEREVLFNKGSKFKIINIKKEKNKIDIKLEEI